MGIPESDVHLDKYMLVFFADWNPVRLRNAIMDIVSSEHPDMRVQVYKDFGSTVAHLKTQLRLTQGASETVSPKKKQAGSEDASDDPSARPR